MHRFDLRYKVLATWFIASLVCASCTPTIAPFSAAAYKQATDLKVDSVRLMQRAEHTYIENETRVAAVQLALDKAFEFSRGRPRNDHSTAQWKILLDPNRNLLGGFIRRWKSESTLSYPFIQEATLLVENAFDTIIGLESGKVRGGS